MTVTGCAEKVAYASEHLASNAAVLHTFVHPECTDVEAYRCPSCSTAAEDVWHIGHRHFEAGRKCKSEPPVRPFRPRQPPRGQQVKNQPNKRPRGAA